MRKRIFGKTIVLFCMVLLFVSCNFFNSFSEVKQGIQITSLTLAKSNLSISVGEMSYITIGELLTYVDIYKKTCTDVSIWPYAIHFLWRSL